MKPDIIIVDDEKDIRVLYIRVFSLSYKARVFATAEADKGVSLALKHPPRLFITDKNHPGMSAVDMVKNLREKISPSKMPIWVITGSVNKAEEKKLRRLGVNLHWHKPFNFGLLMKKCDSLLGAPGR